MYFIPCALENPTFTYKYFVSVCAFLCVSVFVRNLPEILFCKCVGLVGKKVVLNVLQGTSFVHFLLSEADSTLAAVFM